MLNLVHFYFGNRILAFEICLGTIIRALGHSKKAKIILLNKNFSWVDNTIETKNVPIEIIDIQKNNNRLQKFMGDLPSFENTVLLLANVDLLFQYHDFEIKRFINNLSQLKISNEILLTSEDKISELVEFADYSSKLSILEP